MLMNQRAWIEIALGFLGFCIIGAIIGFDWNRASKTGILFLILAIVCVLLWCGWWFLIPAIYGSKVDAGQSGDLFGSLTSLFSVGSFIGVVYAIILQGNELRLQRKELRDQREEFSIKTEIDSFYQLLNLVRNENSSRRTQFTQALAQHPRRYHIGQLEGWKKIHADITGSMSLGSNALLLGIKLEILSSIKLERHHDYFSVTLADNGDQFYDEILSIQMFNEMYPFEQVHLFPA